MALHVRSILSSSTPLSASSARNISTTSARSFVEIFGADEADNGVDEERIERTCNAIGARFQRQLVDAVMRLGGERTSLPRFEIHHVVAAPGHIARPMMIQNTLAAFPPHRELNAEALVRCLRAGDGLEQQIDRHAVIQTRQLV